MPSGKVHTAMTIATASGVIAPYAVVNLGGDPYLYIAGCLAGILLTPDHDVDAGNISHSIIRKVSTVSEKIWKYFWLPYALAIPHRGTLSHFPFIGTLARLGYLMAGINLIGFIGWGIVSLVGIDTMSHFIWWWNWSFFFGLAHSDIVHWAADLTIKGKEIFIDE